MTDPEKPSIPGSVQDAAGEWLVRRQAGTLPDVERAFTAWLEADPRHRRAYDQVERGWQDSGMLADSDIGRTRTLGRAPFLMRHSTHVGAASLGIAAVLGMVTIGVVRQAGPFELVSPAEAATYQTALGEIRTIRLADGSQVTLDTATLVRVAFTPQARHLVLERGRARFRVVPDSQRPFTVAVTDGEVLARSSLFDVSVTEKPARVSAFEGTLELQSSSVNRPAAAQTLATGEKTVLDSRTKPQRISAADARWVAGMLALDATPLGDAIASINRYNRLQVRLADPRLASLSITGAFRTRDPDQFARAVAAMFNLRVDRSDMAIILHEPRQPTPSLP